MKPAEADWRSVFAEHGEPVFRVGTRGDDVVAEWVGAAQLTASRNGKRHTLVFASDLSAESRRKIERGSAMVLLRHLEGKLSLHGAAVARDGRALVLLGRSGQGKSTLAAAFCRAGWALLADDAVALDRDDSGIWRVSPTEDEHWLDTAASGVASDPVVAIAQKVPVRAARVATAPTRLVALVDIVNEPNAPEVRLESTTGVDAIASIIPQAVRFLLDDDERNAHEVETLVKLVENVRTYTLRRRRDYALLSVTVAALERLAGGINV